MRQEHTGTQRCQIESLLRSEEVARLVGWLAEGLRAGEVVAREDGEVRRFRPASDLRARVAVEQRPGGGRIRVVLEWEAETNAPLEIDLA